MRALLLALAAAALAAGCSGTVTERPPESALEGAIFLREAAPDGWHGISDADPLSGVVRRVVQPAAVDAEARIEILLDEARLSAAAAERGAGAGARLRLQAFVERPGADPVPLHLSGYDAIDRFESTPTDPALAGARATELDLTRTIARPGDRLLLRAAIADAAGAALGGTYEARLRVAQLGWHSEFHPSVVLARPAEAGAAEAEFRFTPGVAWLHAYSPRHDESGAWADWMRATQASFGPHALLLQFDTEDEVEIGLGLTAGFWDGVLQVGVGYNLMADGGQDRHYFYVGSSMIALAQAGQRAFGGLPGF